MEVGTLLLLLLLEVVQCVLVLVEGGYEGGGRGTTRPNVVLHVRQFGHGGVEETVGQQVVVPVAVG